MLRACRWGLVGKRNSASQPTRANSPSVIGLEHGRALAAKQAKRKSRSNAIKIGVLAVMAFAAIGTAAWAGYDYWESEQQREADERNPGQYDMDPREAIDILEDQPAWNGPGNATFGVGDGDDQP